ncbi:MAG TPA: helix-turn-helix transcriptional regulator [Bdellovibrionales bacterium]|nr:helix-turn-helix transcriptional regulator [Bdellovibrionales bacterium]
MNFTPEEVRQLRYRLGYSQAEMARHLHVDFSVFSQFEAGKGSLSTELNGMLVRILQQAESLADRTQRGPIAEVIMKDRGLSQIHDFEVDIEKSK